MNYSEETKMRRTKILMRDLWTLQASEELYIVITLAKLGAFACGVAVGYWIL
jgi:hypothetical protein